MANAIKSIAKIIRRDPESKESVVLSDLCAALENGDSFELERLFSLKEKAFDLALALLDEWKFDRHVVSRRLQKYLDHEED